MKVLKINLTTVGCLVGLLATAVAQPAANPSAATSAPASTNSSALQADRARTATEAGVVQAESAPTQSQAMADQAASATTNATADATTSTNAPLADGVKGLRPNFVDAPLRLVAQYLARAAGLIVYDDPTLTGTITVQSDQPLTKDEAIDLFNAALKKNGYILQRGEGRVLRIVRSYLTEPIETITPNQVTNVVPTSDIVTAIVPVKNVDATSLITTLLHYTVPGESLDLDASVGANAIVVRSSKAHLHRMLELIKALDNPLYSESKVRAFPLLYADAKALAQMIKDLFPAQNMRGGFGANVAGFGGGGRGGRGGGGAAAANPFLALLTAGGGPQQNTSRMTAPNVVATADDRSNTLIVMGSDEQLTIIADVVANVDVNVEDKMEVRLFHLVNTDPQAVATYLQTLYPNPTTTQQNQAGRGGFGMRGGGGFAGGGFGGRGGGAAATTGSSDRVRQETTVLAVADSSKGDLVVKASHSMLEEIADWLNQLDSDTSGQIVVKYWTLDNTDPTLVLQQLQSMFPSAYGSSSSYLNQRTIGSQLTQREQTQLNNLGRNTGGTIGTGSSSFGGGGSSLPSDRNIKTNFTAVDSQAVLAKVANLPITAWSYKADADTRHIGPMAQDFRAAFQLGSDDKSIAVVDEGGVALAAIQGLNEKLDAKDAEIQALQKQVAELKALVQSLAAKPVGSSTPGQSR